MYVAQFNREWILSEKAAISNLARQDIAKYGLKNGNIGDVIWWSVENLKLKVHFNIFVDSKQNI